MARGPQGHLALQQTTVELQIKHETLCIRLIQYLRGLQKVKQASEIQGELDNILAKWKTYLDFIGENVETRIPPFTKMIQQRKWEQDEMWPSC